MIGTIIDTLATLALLRLGWNACAAYLNARGGLVQKCREIGLGSWFADTLSALVIGGQSALLLAAVWL